jgi:hypothetical protein
MPAVTFGVTFGPNFGRCRAPRDEAEGDRRFH